MTTNIQLLRSSIAYKRPSAAPLLDGQAAINLNAAEPGLFWRLTNGQLAKAGPVAITDNGMEPNAAPAGETGNSLGEEWLDAHPALHAPILHVFNGTEFVTANGFTVDKSTGNLTLLRQLEVTHLLAGTAQVNGNMVLAGNLTPAGQNCAFYLGLPSERWDYFYGCNFDVKFDGNVSRNLTVGQDAIIDNNLTVSQHVASNLTPDVDSTRLLGREDKRWIAYNSYLNVSGTTELGTTCTDQLIVKSTGTFKCPVKFESTVDFDISVKDFEAHGAIKLGDACNTSSINLIGAVTQSCDITPATDNSRKIGLPDKRLANLYTVNLKTDGTATIANGSFTSITTGTLTVTGQSNLNNTTISNLTVTGDCTIGTNGSNNLVVNSNTDFKGDVSFDGTVNFPDAGVPDPIFIGSIDLGNGCNSSTVALKGATTFHCNANPVSNNTIELGSSSNKFKSLHATDVYTGDLHLKNEHGDWTMIEAEEYLTLRNNKTGKVFRLMMEEV